MEHTFEIEDGIAVKIIPATSQEKVFLSEEEVLQHILHYEREKTSLQEKITVLDAKLAELNTVKTSLGL